MDGVNIEALREVKLKLDEHIELDGQLTVPEGATGIVLFAHGSGSSRFSPRNQCVAADLNQAGLATLLFDLLTRREEEEDLITGAVRFNITLLGQRLIGATDWILNHPETRNLKIGYFGASTGAAAALIAAAAKPDKAQAVVSRGGRPDLAGSLLEHVIAPTLLIVGGKDTPVIEMNQVAYEQIATSVKELKTVPGASHLFEEPGAMEEVSRLAILWFKKHLEESSEDRSEV